MHHHRTRLSSLILMVVAACMMAPVAGAADQTLLNVSYDPTRELYQAINAAFCAHYHADTGHHIAISQSHDGSGTNRPAQ